MMTTLHHGITALLYKQEFDREYDKWSLSLAETAELSAPEVYALIAEMIRNASATVLQLPNEDTAQPTERTG
jgi:hypothetical protein